ncbi:TonB-linked SusC/RagA family outer membrane protein [Pedobacter sp. AK017]|uniref:SusC/RagA family TonB-linked outer membrane protein n=1 Tax=Pedobacter sp. AK017 TaxID=2723073 RepID=UPI001607A792|nr:TonB-dependent receptor [Pedobacter sp. AK017]MBB5440343.1 TonB-linked SusC/RagA family outer membrane protein [Pedobacter sp. AK017]
MQNFIKPRQFLTARFVPLYVFFLLSFSLNTSAQVTTQPLINSTLDGTVKDAKTGETLPGALIRIEGTSHQVTADHAGKFRFVTGQKFPYTLIVNYVGYDQVKLFVDGSPVEIRLTATQNQLGEVVVVGYGTQKKQDVIGSISQISANKINNRQTPQLSNALTGQLSGVTVIQRSGKPGAGSGDINIRGVGSFGAATTPLIIVDGIPASNFNEIDPNDVASVSVLKDASSAAIYGARAANGVVLITTKNGKAGKTRISYNAYAGFQKATAYPEFVNSWEFAELYNEASGSQSYTPADIQKYRDGSNPDLFPNTNFIDAVLSKNGIQTAHNITASGGTEKNQFNISGGYLFQDGLVVKNYYNKYNLRLNLVNELSPKLTLTTRISAINSDANEPGTPATLDANGVLGIISSTVRYPAIYAGKLSDGTYGLGVVQKGTPISFLETESFTKTKNQNLSANLRLDYQAVPELKLSILGAYNQLTNNQKDFSASQVLNPTLTLGPNQLSISTGNTQYKTLQLLADYTKTINKHAFGLLAGASYEDNHTESLDASRDKLPGNDLTEINVGAQDNQKNAGTASEWAIQSVFGRLKYNFDQRYLFEGTIRYDGSSRFPTTSKYAFFPSAAIGWRISQEKFIKDKISWLNDLKLRASYGILGNQNIANYPYQNTLNTGVNYSFGGVISSGVALTQLTDPNLHWESTRTADIGIDVSLFKGKLNAGATYFDRNTYDILYSPASSVSTILGFDLSQQNTGKLVNKGLEFTLDHINTVGAFTYNINANLTIINNKVKDLGVGNIRQPNGLTGNGSSLFIGHPLELYYGYIADGLFVDAADVGTWPNMTAINPSAKPGDIRYKDISGPDGVPDGKVDATYDRAVLGSRIPKYSYGINLGAAYKGFDFNVLFQGIAGVKGTLDSYAGYAFNNFGNVQTWQKDERWMADNPRRDAGYPRLEIISNSGTPNTLTSSFWIINTSYIKIKSAQLGYTLPGPVSAKAGLSKARIYLGGENFLNWNNYRKGWDPEINTGGSYYPILATYTVGLNVTF